ncbi:MAG: hypothetical protein LIP01_00120 [Tannerellaceae bacterium]|nr:hypothetical protein [Tannerellaceae bacterium]
MLHARTYNLGCIVIHLSPFEWEYRLKEAHQITGYIAEKQLQDYLIMGDFNSFSPFDTDEIDKMTVLKERYIKSEANNPRKNMRGNKFDYSVISCFLASGATDICREFVPASQRGTYPTSTLYKKEWDDPEVAQRRKRIDFILVSPALVTDCTKATIHNGRDADPLSDHYPVSVEIKRK